MDLEWNGKEVRNDRERERERETLRKNYRDDQPRAVVALMRSNYYRARAPVTRSPECE